MLSSNNIVTGILLLSLILISAANFKLKNVKSTDNSVDLKKMNLYQETVLSDYEDRILLGYENNSLVINRDFLPDSLINQISEFLFLRFPENACTTCLDSLMIQVDRNFSSSSIAKYVFLVPSGLITHVNQLKRYYQFEFPFILYTDPDYQISSSKLEELNFPYFFTISDCNTTENTFIPDREDESQTIKYINSINTHR